MDTTVGEFGSHFCQALDAVCTKREKLTPAQFTSIHQEAYRLSNSQNIDELKALHQETVSQVQTYIKNFIMAPFQQVSEHISVMGVDDIKSLESLLQTHWSTIQDIDRLTKRIFNGRKWFLENHSDILICASVHYKQQLTSLVNFHQLRNSLESKPSLSALFQFLDSPNHNSYVGMIGTLQSMPSVPLPRHHFTRTKNVLIPFQYCFTPEMSLNEPPRRIDLPFSNSAFLIENFFSPSECQHLIDQSEKVGYESIETEFLKINRDNERILLISFELANEILKRATPFIKQTLNLELKRPFGFNSKGTWELCGINECLRFCKYTAPSVGFSPHRDANFVRNENERSIFTIMFYLNDNYSGGTTNFMKLHTPGKMDETIQEEMNRGYSMEYKFVPKIGTAIVFKHNILHEGSPLLEGIKYIARTDVVFKRTSNPGDNSWQRNPYYLKMLEYYRIAGEEECKGNVALSSEYYERALSIRQNYVETN